MKLPRHALQDHGAALPALHLAAARGDAATVAGLLAAGADPLQLDPLMGASPLHLAAQGGSAAVMEALLQYGAFVNLQSHSHGMTPLMISVWHRRPAVAKVLLAHPDIDPTIRSRLGMTAEEMLDTKTAQDAELRAVFGGFHARVAAARQRQPLLAVLEDEMLSGAEKEARIATLLAEGADPDVVAPVHSARNPGHTPLLIAARDGLAGAVQALLDAGADPTLVDHFMLAHAAHKAAYMGHDVALVALTRHERFAEIADAQGPFNGYTALHDAVWHGHVEAVRLLLEAGVRSDLLGHDGRSAADLARDYGYDEILALLESGSETGLADARRADELTAGRLQ